MNLLRLFISLILGDIAVESKDESVALFRKHTLNTLNSARRLIASGDIRKILEILQVSSKADLNYFGPATRMYKLVWSRKLELASYEYANLAGETLSDPTSKSTLIYKDFIGFYWLGDLTAAVKTFSSWVPGNVGDLVKDYYDLIEGLIMFLLIFLSAPSESAIKPGHHFGPAELMYGDRFEIGCHTNWIYAICFVEKMEYQRWFFEIGVSCFKCPGQCEFWETRDGEYEEGDLCVPPHDFYTKQIAEAQSITESNGSFHISFMISMFIVVFHFYRR